MNLKNVIIAIMLLLTLNSVIIAEECYESSIISPYPFMGNDKEIFKLSDGSEWEVTQEGTFLFLYEYRPKIMICPSDDNLMIKGETLRVKNLRPKEPTNDL